NEVGGQRCQSIVLAIRPTVFNQYIPAFDISVLAQALAKRGDDILVFLSRGAAQKSDHRHPRPLLRQHRDWPCGRSAGKTPKNIASSDHSITSSVSASSVGGISTRSALAVLRLITNSNLV